MLLECERLYISSLVARGFTAKKVRNELISIGWHPKSAGEAVDEVFDSKALSAAQLFPAPDLDELPTSLRIDDRDLLIQLRVHRPNLCLISNFLSNDECDQAIEESRPRLARSKVILRDGDKAEESIQAYSRTSEQANFPEGTSILVDRIRDRVAKFARWPSDHIESPQVVRYRIGADFGPHHDYFCPIAHKQLIERDGQRVASVIVYLTAPHAGGATAFPDLELEIYPQRGNALFFSYPTAHPNSMTLHAGVPLGGGEKWIITFFLRDRAVACR